MERRMRHIHPGEILREEVIAANELKVSAAAKMLGISCQSLNKIIQEQFNITPEMSFIIAKAFGGNRNYYGK